jgi:hypothetical protein
VALYVGIYALDSSLRGSDGFFPSLFAFCFLLFAMPAVFAVVNCFSFLFLSVRFVVKVFAFRCIRQNRPRWGLACHGRDVPGGFSG